MSKFITAAALIAIAGAAQADVIASFSFENLESSYDLGAQTLSTTSKGSSTGSVSRFIDPAGDADFGAGSADFALTLQVSNIAGNAADGLGTLLIRDLNGDSITADIHGTFSYVPIFGSTGIIFFNGVIGDLVFNDISGDGEFNGQTMSFSSDFSGTGLNAFSGAIQRLEINSMGFFTNGWSNLLAEVDGQIVPTPGVLGLLAASGLVGIRRRR
jgi:hypothetical protein